MRHHAPYLVAAVLLVGCNFDPAVERPTSGMPDGGMSILDASDNGSNRADASGIDGSTTDTGTTSADTGGEDATSMPDASTSDVGTDAGMPDMAPTLCDGEQVDTSTDPDNCGVCGNACDSQYGDCVAGECVCDFGAEPCGDDNLCKATEVDPQNCGSCGNVCDAGEICLEGDCRCRPGLTRCSGTCVDTDSDPLHCGSCNSPCGGDACLDGSCEDRNFCPFGYWTCDQPGGKACVQGDETDLYCDPSISNPCGTECGGDQFCFDPGILQGPQCVTYRPGIGCTDCPCADCGSDEACTESDDVPDVAYCISR